MGCLDGDGHAQRNPQNWFQHQENGGNFTTSCVTLEPMHGDSRNLDTELGRPVRALRQRRGLSQADLAERVGVDRKTINRIENGRHSTSVTTLASIAHSLGEKPSELVSSID